MNFVPASLEIFTPKNNVIQSDHFRWIYGTAKKNQKPPTGSIHTVMGFRLKMMTKGFHLLIRSNYDKKLDTFYFNQIIHMGNQTIHF